jgi:Fe-S-cluster-containing hydrogenase component 2
MSFLQRLKAFITQEEVGATGATAPSNKNFADGGAPVIGPACNGCTLCEEICPVNAIDGEPGKQHVIDPDACNGCGVCMDRCAFGAITMPGTGANAGAGAVSASMSERRGMSHVPGKENMGTDFAEKEKDLKAREEKLLELEGKARKKQISDFVESLKGKGIIVPAMEKLGMGISSFLEAIAGLDTTYEFAELSPSPSGRGEGVREKHTPLAFMQAFLSGLPKVVTFSEVATAAGDPGPSATGEGTSPLLEKLVKEFQEKNPKATLQTAYIEVAREHPELFEDDYRKMVKA